MLLPWDPFRRPVEQNVPSRGMRPPRIGRAGSAVAIPQFDGFYGIERGGRSPPEGDCSGGSAEAGAGARLKFLQNTRAVIAPGKVLLCR